MEYIGIDLGARYSHISIGTTEDKPRLYLKVATEELPGWLAQREPSRVVMEACTQSPRLASAALAAHHDVRVVPGQLVRALGVGARGIKTDKRDAEVLANASMRIPDLPSVHLRSASSVDTRGLLASRALLVKSRTALTLSIKSWLRGRLVTLRGRMNAQTFPEQVRQVALSHAEGLPFHIDALLRSFEALSEQIRQLDSQVKEIASNDAACQRLQTIPGIGPIVALSFKTQVDDCKRFGSAAQIASYLALVPGEATTGGNVKRTSSIKAGPLYLKALLVQSAWSM